MDDLCEVTAGYSDAFGWYPPACFADVVKVFFCVFFVFFFVLFCCFVGYLFIRLLFKIPKVS